MLPKAANTTPKTFETKNRDLGHEKPTMMLCNDGTSGEEDSDTAAPAISKQQSAWKSQL
jgi:hypothetical protein